MERIFKKPLILNGKNDNVVLIYSKYIIGNISKEIADLSIERIDKNTLNVSRFESIVKIKEIFKYKFEPENDSHIMFGVKNVTGTSYVTIDFKDVETTKQAEISLKEQFKQLGFRRKEEQVTPAKAAVFPLITTLIVTLAGSLLTWLAYDLESYQLVQDNIINGYIYLLEKGLKLIGYYPILILTVLLLVFCLIWTLKKVSNLPLRIKSYR